VRNAKPFGLVDEQERGAAKFPRAETAKDDPQ
jgi:hypothetical protein